ncbi:hypothetical protein JHK87_031651 [Glycine soja]|nr:hypothetical protein JHK87_031651 [Glycine soja]
MPNGYEHITFLSHLHHFQQFLPPLSLANLRIQCLGELHQHRLGLPDAHDEIGVARLEATVEVGDGVNEEGGAVGVGLVEARCRLAVVEGVKAVDGEDREGVVVGGGEALIVEEAEVVAEPDEGGTVEGGGIGRVTGAVGNEGERGVEGIGGDGEFEGGFGRKRKRSGGGERKGDENEDEEKAVIGFRSAFSWLVEMTLIISLLSEYVVATIEAASDSWGISVSFISIILLPIVGNAAEHVGSIIFAFKNKLDISLGVAMGSATQISMFVVPFSVVVAWIMGIEMDLDFNLLETGCLAFTIIVTAFTLQIKHRVGSISELEHKLGWRGASPLGGSPVFESN